MGRDCDELVVVRLHGHHALSISHKTHLAHHVMQRHNVQVKDHCTVVFKNSIGRIFGDAFHHTEDAQYASGRCHNTLQRSVTGKVTGAVEQHLGEQGGDNSARSVLQGSGNPRLGEEEERKVLDAEDLDQAGVKIGPSLWQPSNANTAHIHIVLGQACHPH